MCESNVTSVAVESRILAGNDRNAGHNRDHFARQGIFCINLMGSPGAGKTAVLEATARAAGNPRAFAALAGDLATDNDAQRLAKAGIRSMAITTGQACHLDADMVHHALHHFDTKDVEYLFVENVGNLVCPAVYDLGQNLNVVALSVTEGEDKPLKYPTMFMKADLVLLTKIDLLPVLDVNVAAIEDAIARVMPSPRVIKVSARQGTGIDAFHEWLASHRVLA
jgi:hydrogenase nickel incorporation protein HypB